MSVLPGIGYVPGEFEALGIPYEERGARTSEHIEVLRTLWTQEKPTFEALSETAACGEESRKGERFTGPL